MVPLSVLYFLKPLLLLLLLLVPERIKFSRKAHQEKARRSFLFLEITTTIV